MKLVYARIVPRSNCACAGGSGPLAGSLRDYYDNVLIRKLYGLMPWYLARVVTPAAVQLLFEGGEL